MDELAALSLATLRNQWLQSMSMIVADVCMECRSFFVIRLNYVQRILILQGLECQEFILSDKECEYIVPTFDHVSPPSRDGQSFIFRYQMKDINREKRIFDFGWINSTDWSTMQNWFYSYAAIIYTQTLYTMAAVFIASAITMINTYHTTTVFSFTFSPQIWLATRFGSRPTASSQI